MMDKRQRGDARTAVVKVQMALTGERPGRGLVYAKGRWFLVEQELPEHVIDHILSLPVPKAYFEAVWLGGAWEIGSLTTDQDW